MPPEPLNISGLAQALLACMEAMKIERTFLVGHSMGCQIAVEVALQHPWRIDRLILIGPTPAPTARSVAEQFRCFLIDSAYERLSLTQYLVKDIREWEGASCPSFGSCSKTQ
jgi:2-hydroxy-6-oxonona-2,4-dienedioate hydrolase